jgi:hypothetical protein
MSTSYVEFHGNGFWCPDTLLEVFACLVGSELQADSPGSLASYGVELAGKARAGLVGCFDLRLDSLSKQHLARLEETSVAILIKIEGEPSLLSAGELNKLRVGRFDSDIPVRQLAALVHVVRELLHERWNFDAADTQALPSRWLNLDLT